MAQEPHGTPPTPPPTPTPTPKEEPPKTPLDTAAEDRAAAAEERMEREQERLHEFEYPKKMSVGAEVVLDPASKASMGARGVAFGTIEENTALRDEGYIELGLDPRDPTGHDFDNQRERVAAILEERRGDAAPKSAAKRADRR